MPCSYLHTHLHTHIHTPSEPAALVPLTQRDTAECQANLYPMQNVANHSHCMAAQAKLCALRVLCVLRVRQKHTRYVELLPHIAYIYFIDYIDLRETQIHEIPEIRGGF